MHAATGVIPEPGSTTLSGRYACYRTYEAADGRWLAVGALERKFWIALCEKLGRSEFVPRQFDDGESQQNLIAEMGTIFKTRTSAEWLEGLAGADTCVTLVRNVAEVAADTELWSSVIPKLSDTPGYTGRHSPKLGEQ